MAEIQSKFTEEQISQYLKDNNLDVSNKMQLGAKLMEIDEKLIEIAENTRLPDFYDNEGTCWMGGRLIDKWNK